MKNGLKLPIIDGSLITNISGCRIGDCVDIINIGGKLNGGIYLLGKGWFPVIDGKIITKIDNNKIYGAYNIHNINGKLNGKVRLKGFMHYIIEGEVYKFIDGVEGYDFTRLIFFNGELNCRIELIDGRAVPVLNSKTIYNIGGRKILDCKTVSNINGKLNCIVRFKVNHILIIGGKIKEEINGKQIDKVTHLTFSSKGYSCIITNNHNRFPVVCGRLITNIGGSEIINCDNIHSINGRLNGKVIFKNGDIKYFLLEKV